MKNIQIRYLFLLLTALFFACSDAVHRYVPSLLRADSLMQAGCTDSALVVLENISTKELVFSSSQARYALLLTQAKDQSYLLHTDDSLIRIAVDYYDGTGDVASRAKAHYYLGRVYQDMNDVEGAVREYLTAMPLAEQMGDYQQTYLLQHNLAYVYWQNGWVDEAGALYRSTLRLAEEKKDSLNWALALTHLSDIDIEKGESHYAGVEKSLNQAILLMKNQQNNHITKVVLISLAYLYERMDRMPEVVSVGKRIISLQPDTTGLYGVYFLMGSAYSQMEKPDSAMYYLNKCLSSDSYAIKESTYMRLADIASGQGKVKEALGYEHKYMAYKDSVERMKQPAKAIAVSKDIAYQQSIRAYRSSLNHSKYYIAFIVLLFSVIAVSLYHKRRKEKRVADSLFKQLHTVSSQLEQVQLLLHQKEDETALLRQRLNGSEDAMKMQQYNDCITKLIDEMRLLRIGKDEALKKKDEIIEELRCNNFSKLMSETDIYRKLQALKKLNKNTSDKVKLTDADWAELENEFDRLLPCFLNQLNHKYEALLRDDIRFCCLVKIGFNYSEIQYILACAPDTVYKRDRGVKKRMRIDQKVKLKEVINEL